MPTVDRSTLQSLMDAASAINSPHVDLGPILGLSQSLRVGVDDVASALLQHDLPAFSVEIANGSEIKVSHIDGGALMTWEGTF